MRFPFKILEPRPSEHVVEVECPTCHDRWELSRPKDVITSTSRYSVICPACETAGFIEL